MRLLCPRLAGSFAPLGGTGHRHESGGLIARRLTVPDTAITVFFLKAGSYGSQLAAVPERFLAQTPSLVALRLSLPRVQALPSSFLAHAPRIQALNLALP